jgi:hypothetical protein
VARAWLLLQEVMLLKKVSSKPTGGISMSEEISELKDAEREDFEQESHERPHRRDRNNWIGGVVLIAIGIIFLLSNVTDFHLDNWWALFILIPAVSSFGKVYSSYQRHGRITRAARGSLTGGFILTLISAAFLLELDWGLIWPVFLIIGGLSALLGGWFD